MEEQINHQNDEIKRCLKLIQFRNPRDRSYAAKHLGELKARPDVLMSLMDDPNGFVRSAAAEALGRSVTLPAPEVVSALLTAIDDPNPFVRPQAVITLAKLLGQEVIADLVDLSEDLNLHVRRAVARSFAEVDHLTSAGKAALLRLADDADTVEITRVAMQKHDLTAIQPPPAANPPVKSPVPETLQGEVPILLELLESWQETLPALQRHLALEEISEVDHSLSTLIVCLREVKTRSE